MKNRVLPYIGLVFLSFFAMGADPVLASENKKVITGFEDFNPRDHYLEIDYHVRPEEESLIRMMPESLMVHVKGEEDAISLPVDWALTGDSIEDTEYYYVEYRPVFDSSYTFDQEIAVEAKMPYVAVFLRENVESYDEASMMDTIVVSKNASARKTSYTSCPYEGKIFDYLHNGLGYNSAVCCGIMANLYAESGFYPNNLQNSGNSALGMTDEEYTRGVDNGTYTNFVHDGRGYGLCQWTYYSRKQGLLDSAISKGVSIADYKMQLAFMKKELAGYKDLVSYIKDAHNSSSDAYNIGYQWCKIFEAPGDTSQPAKRGNLAQNELFPIYRTEDYDEDYADDSNIILSLSCRRGDLYETTTDLYLRSGPGISYESLGVIDSGSKVIVEKKDGKWGAISIYGITGYISLDYCNLLKEDVDYHKYGEEFADNPGSCEEVITKVCKECGYTLTTTSKNHVFDGNVCMLCGGLKELGCPEVNVLLKSDHVRLEWDEIDDITSYEVYKKREDGVYERVKSTLDLYYKDKNVENGDECCYAVIAVNADGTEVHSDMTQSMVSCVYLAPMPAKNISLKNKKDGVEVSFQTMKGAEGYQIFRRKQGNNSFSYIGSVKEGNVYVDKKAVNGTSYDYRIKAYRGSNLAAAGEYKSITALKHMTFATENLKGAIRLSWDNDKAVDGYQIYRKNADGKFVLIAELSSSKSQFTDYDVKNLQRNYYKVLSYKGDFASTGEAKARTYVPATKTRLSNSADGVKISWSKVAGVDAYYIYRKVSGGSYKKLKEVSASKTSYVDSSVSNTNLYRYYVRAVYNGSASAYDSVSIRRFGKVSLDLSNVSSGLKIKWSSVSRADGYYIYRRKASSDTYSRIATLNDGSKSSYIDKNAANGSVYYYRVVPFDGEYVGAKTDGKSFVRLKRGGIYSVTVKGPSMITVRASQNSAASGYIVEVSRKKDFSAKDYVDLTGSDNTIQSFKKLQADHNYYVRVRSYKKYNGRIYYSAWSAKEKVRTEVDPNASLQ